MVKILVAEDEYVTQKKVLKIAESMGHIVFISPNGRHALETLLVNDGFGIVITDMVMPEMDGRKLIENMKKNEKTKHLPIILISAYATISDIKELLKMGVTYFLPKPINSEDLKKHIDNCIKNIILD